MSKRYQGGFVSATRPTTAGGSTGIGSAPGIWEMETVGRAVATSAWPLAGNWIDDVFSTYLYTGNGATQTIVNGIDLATKGGLIWSQIRSGTIGTNNGALVDTVRGINSSLVSNSTSGATGGLAYSDTTSFNTNGFSLGYVTALQNRSGNSMASWTFRKQPKFFDIVTWTGNGTNNRQISHALESVPGCIIVKELSQTGSWYVYHRINGTGKYLRLNATDTVTTSATYFPAVSSTTFTPTSDTTLNTSSVTYVAYLFAHDAGGFGASGTENVISCGSWTASSTAAVPVNLGWEPQYVLVKNTNTAQNWFVWDTMRGMPVDSGQPYLIPNLSSAESIDTYYLSPTQTGFTVRTNALGNNGDIYIYVAIRRPMKPPTTGTSVYYGLSREGTSTNTTVTGSPFPVDLAIIKNRFNNDGMASNSFVFDRLRGRLNAILANTTDAQNSAYTGSLTGFDVQNGYTVGNETSGWVNYAGASNGALYMNWMFRRAPGFLDIVSYTGNNAVRTVAHALGAVPQLIITKPLSGAGNWATYAAPVGPGAWLRLESTTTPTSNLNTWNNTNPTSTVFSLGAAPQANANGLTFIAYLFASLPGVSQVGSYTGTAASLNINCGFTTGARFVLIKRTDATGAWYVFDTTRGIVAGNEVYMMLNDTGRDVSADWIAPLASGFQLTSGGSATVNVNGGTYIFLAIA